MVLLGGLELVAAGYVLNEFNKDSKKDVKKHRTDSKDRRDRKDHRKHHHRRDSSPSPHRPRPQQQNLLPPQVGPPRPYSAPPPSSRPGWQPQHFHGQQQQWHPNAGAPHPHQPAPMPYHPPQQVPMPFHPPQNLNQPIPAQRPPMNNIYPPAGTYIDMKTGKIQHNLYPPEQDPFGRQRSLDTDRMRSEDEAYPHERSAARSQTYQPDGAQHERSIYSPASTNQQPVPIPRAGYIELDAETPGRYRPYDEKREGPPPAYWE